MKNGTRSSNTMRRTTVTLSAGTLRRAKQAARTRNVKLSTVVSEALEKDLKLQADAEKRKAAWDAYCKSLRQLSEEDLMALDGIILTSKGR